MTRPSEAEPHRHATLAHRSEDTSTAPSTAGRGRRVGDVFEWSRKFRDADFPVSGVSLATAKAVGWAMASYADGPSRKNPGGNIRPSQGTVGEHVGIKRHQVMRAQAALVAAGWLIKKPERPGSTNVWYALSEPSDAPSEPTPRPVPENNGKRPTSLTAKRQRLSRLPAQLHEDLMKQARRELGADAPRDQLDDRAHSILQQKMKENA